MVGARSIPQATVARLPLYLRVLREAAAERATTLSSEVLAARVGVTAAQLRKDLSHLGSYGTRGVGYDVEYLVREIGRRLGLGEERRVAIVGAGNLGQALARYGGFSSRGFRVVAVFDADPAKVGTLVGSTPVTHSSEMAAALGEARVDIAVITTPAQSAQRVVDTAVGAGVGSILNFAPTTVTVPPGVAIRQVDLGIELQILTFYQQRVESASGVRPCP
jgi:redox-sensing transcriptional repressor